MNKKHVFFNTCCQSRIAMKQNLMAAGWHFLSWHPNCHRFIESFFEQSKPDDSATGFELVAFSEPVPPPHQPSKECVPASAPCTELAQQQNADHHHAWNGWRSHARSWYKHHAKNGLNVLRSSLVSKPRQWRDTECNGERKKKVLINNIIIIIIIIIGP